MPLAARCQCPFPTVFPTLEARREGEHSLSPSRRRWSVGRPVFQPISSSNLSAPALFRTLHDRGGTLLLDEAERLGEASPEVAELRSILLAS